MQRREQTRYQLQITQTRYRATSMGSRVSVIVAVVATQLSMAT